MMLFISIFLFATLYVSQVQSIDKTEKYRLNDGNWIPATAYGTSMQVDLNDRRYVPQTVAWAIESGYRHIDTAFLYGTEDMIALGVNSVIKRGIVKREDMFITTKLPFSVVTSEQVIVAIRDALNRLQMDYVDLCLIHTPRNVLNIKNRDYVEIWKGLENAKEMRLTKSIGISNFNATEINRILLKSKTPPAVCEIETNPTYTDQELVAYCQSKNIMVMGYSPFGFAVPRPYNDLSLPPTFNNPVIMKMAKKYQVEASQIFLRYLVERNIIPIAGSLDKKHIELNADIFNFTMCQEDVLEINEFDRHIKVHIVDYDGLEREMFDDWFTLKRYVAENNLRNYRFYF